MARVFTITEGLENMGALRTGGQGSVYKGRRVGEIFTAVKILPTPIHAESTEDKNFQSFQNEVLKLKKVNEVPNPNVVKILNSGITESGSFPFIEMEFIEGPDLEELLKSPHDPLFSVREVIKVADQLSGAIAHCHKVGVKHGDIKSNNVKFNIHTANYVLLDFGLAVMSDEQRRTSLRHAGAIEFMAPEQNEGKMLFQTDVYSFGVVLYELLAGQVPFPLQDGGETNRNTVMLSHMETPVPDLMSLRRANMPKSWSDERREREMQVPGWLLEVIGKCLEKKPENRYEDGVKLHEAILINSTKSAENTGAALGSAAAVQTEISQLQSQVLKYEQESRQKDQEIERLRRMLANNEDGSAGTAVLADSSSVSISKTALFALIFLVVGLGAFAAFSFFSDKNAKAENSLSFDSLARDEDTTSTASRDLPANDIPVEEIRREDTMTVSEQPEAEQDSLLGEEEQQPEEAEPASEADATKEQQEHLEELKNKKKYTLAVNKAYFHDQPDESTRRNAFLVHWNNAELTAVEEKNGFIYVVFFNTQGQVTKGWLRKKDLKRIN
ncbi:serine/threonine-protein kinase [Pedobacter sp. SYSU D00535]|uniref:serine/threonine protein kinase n=1 Tax=Pedobacter sp. SYSU D00535 TaxID=2810308 RepID=UPI001A9570A9|nr:serine/threonine-protein kinase [Pedobacter sp. SYSU D00535]